MSRLIGTAEYDGNWHFALAVANEWFGPAHISGVAEAAIWELTDSGEIDEALSLVHLLEEDRGWYPLIRLGSELVQAGRRQEGLNLIDSARPRIQTVSELTHFHLSQAYLEAGE